MFLCYTMLLGKYSVIELLILSLKVYFLNFQLAYGLCLANVMVIKGNCILQIPISASEIFIRFVLCVSFSVFYDPGYVKFAQHLVLSLVSAFGWIFLTWCIFRLLLL